MNNTIKGADSRRIIFTTYMADYLLENGEVLLFVRPDLKNPDKNVFVFRYSETFDKNFDAAIRAQQQQ